MQKRIHNAVETLSEEAMDDIKQQEIVKQLEQLCKDMEDGKLPPLAITTKSHPDRTIEVTTSSGVIALVESMICQRGVAHPVFADETYISSALLLDLNPPVTQKDVENTCEAFRLLDTPIHAIVMNCKDIEYYEASN